MQISRVTTIVDGYGLTNSIGRRTSTSIYAINQSAYDQQEQTDIRSFRRRYRDKTWNYSDPNVSEMIDAGEEEEEDRSFLVYVEWHLSYCTDSGVLGRKQRYTKTFDKKLDGTPYFPSKYYRAIEIRLTPR